MPKERVKAHPKVLQVGTMVRVAIANCVFGVGTIGRVTGKFRMCRFCTTKQLPRLNRQRCEDPGKSWCQWDPYWVELEVTYAQVTRRQVIQARNCEPKEDS